MNWADAIGRLLQGALLCGGKAFRRGCNGDRGTLSLKGGVTVPEKAWSPKRERQYEHIKESYEERGRSEDKAEELAARTVNKERAEKGETKEQRSRSRRS